MAVDGTAMAQFSLAAALYKRNSEASIDGGKWPAARIAEKFRRQPPARTRRSGRGKLHPWPASLLTTAYQLISLAARAWLGLPAAVKSRDVQLWSAAPTPLGTDLRVDTESVERMVEAAIADGMNGLFLGGTCGEGPWLPDRERKKLVHIAASTARGRLRIATQVSDNSGLRVSDNIDAAAEAGADLAIIAPPAMMMNATAERIAAFFAEIVPKAALPVGIYDLGSRHPYGIPSARLKEIYVLPNVRLVKDSSGEPERCDIALEARRENPILQLFNGDEFHCVDYLEAGYDGCMFGGAIAVAPSLHQIVELVQSGCPTEAREVEREMTALLHGIYGGPEIMCWLTGLKYYLVRTGLFASAATYLEYPLTDSCRRFIEAHAANSSRIQTAAAEGPGAVNPA